MKIWNISYHDQIKSRILNKVCSLTEQLDSITKGRTMPDPEDVRIGSGKYMEIAVLFIDICKFTSRGSDNENEQKEILIMLNLFISEMMAIIRDYGGIVEKNTGDGLMAYFGTESKDANCIALDAVLASITMHYVTSNFINPLLQNMRVYPISFRIGIDQGKVTIARIGVPNLNRITAVGATANIACRLLDLAGPNQTFIGNEVYLNLPIQLKELCRPVFFKSTGYIYVATKRNYPIWEYIGRWRKPIK